jgi:hypothetical protein
MRTPSVLKRSSSVRRIQVKKPIATLWNQNGTISISIDQHSYRATEIAAKLLLKISSTISHSIVVLAP